ncbi:MAG: hypothetical protein WCH44_09885 [Betaproteobacteria bacterium]
MGLSSRRFFVTRDGTLYRISNAKFERMMRNPDTERLPLFSGQRIRSAELVVELFDREPCRVCRETFSILQFDGDGRVDVARRDQQQVALVNAMLAPIFDSREPSKNVLDATDRFVAQGGTWNPTDSMRVQIERAALALLDCPTL